MANGIIISDATKDWITVNQYVDYKVSNGFVSVKFKKLLTNSLPAIIATLPSEYAPKSRIMQILYNLTVSGTTYIAGIIITSDGKIQSYGNTTLEDDGATIIVYPLSV